MKKIIQTSGLLLFLLGFGFFIGSFFSADFKLTGSSASEVIGNEELTGLFVSEAPDLIDKTYSSNFVFISDLEKTLNKINQKQLEKYSINQFETEWLVQQSEKNHPIRFETRFLDEVFQQDEEVGAFKRKSFLDNGSWMDGREYSNREDLKQELESTIENINKYGVISQKGFDRYKIKDLKYSLTRASSQGPVDNNPSLFLFLTYGLCIIGAVLYLSPKFKEGLPGIKNNGIFFSNMKTRGWLGILTGTFLILFYVFLYFYPEYMTNWIIMVDPLSFLLKGSAAGRFFLYGFIYTLAILVMGVRMLARYRHSKYQMIRTFSVMFFQTAFAFLIPEILLRLNQPYFDFKNIWPLDYDFFFDTELTMLIQSGSLGIFMLGWGIALILIGVPVFVYFFGKRWYCSWVCGCGGLAETLGDPYRQLSDKRLNAWKAERIIIHLVLIFAVVMTGGVLYTYWTGAGQVLGINTYSLRETYGAWIGAGFAGVVGTGFYPLMGNRVWCRFGCPLAAYLGMVQRFKSRFRITTNGGQCISCGNCSTYCEMGIDVRWYAQRGQNVIRSSCVGCGICSAVCPRGVLNLENRDEEGRFGQPVLLGNESFKQPIKP